MAKDKDANIFETARKQGKKNVESSPTPPKPSLEKPAPAGPPPSDAELEKMFRHAKEMHQQIEHATDSMYEKLKLHPDRVEEFTKSIHGINRENAEKNMVELRRSFESILGKKLSEAPTSKTKRTLEKSRKAKTLASRKKWMPMD